MTMGLESFQQQSVPRDNQREGVLAHEFSVQEAQRVLSSVQSWESLENALTYLVYIPMSNGERVMANEWISRIDRVRNGESVKLITSTGGLRATVERLLGNEQRRVA